MKKQKKALTKEEILDAIRKHRDILLRYKVREIGLFGSFVRGENMGSNLYPLFWSSGKEQGSRIEVKGWRQP